MKYKPSEIKPTGASMFLPADFESERRSSSTGIATKERHQYEVSETEVGLVYALMWPKSENILTVLPPQEDNP